MRLRVLPVVVLGAGCGAPEDGSAPCDDAVTVTAEGLLLEGGACGSAALAARVLGEGDLEVDLVVEGGAVRPRVRAGSGGGMLWAVHLAGPLQLSGTGPARVWRQGYQSWSWSGVVEAAPVGLDGEGLPQAGGDGDTFSFASDTPFTSWWGGLLGRTEGPSLLLGAVSATVLPVVVALDETQVHVTWGGRGDAVVLAPGEERVLDPVGAWWGRDPWDLHRTWARAVAAEVPPRPLSPVPPAGWGSWSAYFEDVDEEGVRAHLEVLGALRDGGAPLDLVQVDDGWEQDWGDWSPNAAFPSGMAVLAGEIQDAGFTPGLWLAPFYVSRETDTWRDHPDWWVRDAAGEEITFSNLGDGSYAVLDATHPDALAWMARQVADRVDEGWGFFKLDFLYAGATPGVRHADVTGLEAFHQGMAALREAAGDAFVLACGAPLLPSVGWVEGFRTGADIVGSWDPEPGRATLRWQARATAARSWTNGLWWWNDPDQVLVGDPLDETEVRGVLAATLAGGGLWLLGDDLTTLPEERLQAAVDPALLALRGVTPRPRAPLAWPSGFDLGPLSEALQPDDQVPVAWSLGAAELRVNLGDSAVLAEGAWGRDLLGSGGAPSGAPRPLAPGDGQVWVP